MTQDNSAQTLDMAELTEQLQQLQMTQAFQEDTIESLEKNVVNQQQDIQMLKNQLRILSDFLKNMRQDGDGIKRPEDEAPPPHY